MKIYPVTILRSRYGGSYEGAEWCAFHDYSQNVKDMQEDDGTCMVFFQGGMDRDGLVDVPIPAYPGPIGRGQTPQDAYASLLDLCLGECDTGAHWDERVEW